GDQEASDEPGGAGDEVAHVLASCDRVARRRPLPANLPERRGGDNCQRLSPPIALVGAAEAASSCSAPPPAKAGGGWEGVPTDRSDPNGTPPQPSPAFAGEGAESSRLPPLLRSGPKARGFRRSYRGIAR